MARRPCPRPGAVIAGGGVTGLRKHLCAPSLSLSPLSGPVIAARHALTLSECPQKNCSSLGFASVLSDISQGAHSSESMPMKLYDQNKNRNKTQKRSGAGGWRRGAGGCVVQPAEGSAARGRTPFSGSRSRMWLGALAHSGGGGGLQIEKDPSAK